MTSRKLRRLTMPTPREVAIALVRRAFHYCSDDDAAHQFLAAARGLIAEAKKLDKGRR